jgi:hypothetical protein
MKKKKIRERLVIDDGKPEGGGFDKLMSLK